MSLSAQFQKPLDQLPNGGKGVVLESGSITKSDFTPGAKGVGSIYINETAGGGPFHLTVHQNGKVITDDPHFVGGNIVSYAIGEKFGARLRVEDGPITFSCTGVKHPPTLVPNFDHI